jgi:hypothetical protein
MEKVQAIGAPFNVEHSSCSDLKPKTFEWSNDDQPIKVFMDGSILSGCEYQKKPGEVKVAWVCESRSIFHLQSIGRESWEKNLEDFCLFYDAIFTSEKSMLSVHPKIQFAFAGSNLPWVKKKINSIEKSKFCSFVSSSKNYTYGHKLRHAVYDTFKDYVDVYGSISNKNSSSKKSKLGNDDWDKSDALVDYMFSFVIENDRYETYYTEKLTDCFMTGTIPVYWGAPDIGDYFDIDGMVILTNNFDIRTLTPELFQSKIPSIIKNYEKVLNLEMADDYVYRKIKELEL